MLISSLLALIVVGAIGVFGLHKSQERFESYQVNIAPSVRALNEVNLRVSRIRGMARDYVIFNDQDNKKSVLSRIDDHYRHIQSILANYRSSLVSDDNDRDFVENDKIMIDKFHDKTKAVFAESDAGKMDQVRRELAEGGEYRDIALKLESQLQRHVDYNWKLGESLRSQNHDDYQFSTYLQVACGLIGFAVCGLFGFFVVREIKSRLARLGSFVTKVSNDLDFTPRVRVTHMDELGVVGDAINKLIERLHVSLSDVSSSAQSIARVSQELAVNASQVAGAANQQSNASANVAATVEQMTVSVNHVADRAQEANEMSVKSGELAYDGSSVIARTTSDINEIASDVHNAEQLIHSLESKTLEIANVIQVIKDIADQTNLLALNAAIEAARAGEQGRGFAVVADEVRKLAERTSSSTKEITDTINSMRDSADLAVNGMQSVVKKVEGGVAGAKKASTSVENISDSSKQAALLVGEITSAIKEQGVATTNIAQQVESIAQMAEESSAAAANTADSARELDRLSGELKRVVELYKLNSAGNGGLI
jgi:methyl-accepting chemotaxis protein